MHSSQSLGCTTLTPRPHLQAAAEQGSVSKLPLHLWHLEGWGGQGESAILEVLLPSFNSVPFKHLYACISQWGGDKNNPSEFVRTVHTARLNLHTHQLQKWTSQTGTCPYILVHRHTPTRKQATKSLAAGFMLCRKVPILCRKVPQGGGTEGNGGGESKGGSVGGSLLQKVIVERRPHGGKQWEGPVGAGRCW